VYGIRYRYYATLPPGLEEIAASEIEMLGGKVSEIRGGRGRVFFEGTIDLIPILNYLSRTLERVMILLTVEKFEKLDDIYRIVRRMDFTPWIRAEQSFAIRPLRVGQHDFTSIDVGRVAGQAVIDSYMEAKNVRLRVNLDEPDVIIRVDVIFDEVMVGVDTTGDDGLHKRGYRVYNHPAPLNPAIAASLVKLSGWKGDESLLDPMCGSGTILIEAAMTARNIPPGKNRDFAFVNVFGEEILEEVRNSVVENKTMVKLYGVEKFRKHIEGAIKNAESVNVADTITFMEGDATKLEELFRDPLDVVITNPPYGLRIGRKGIIEELYNGFLKSLRNITHDKSRIVIITTEDKIMRDAVLSNDYEIVKELNVKYGGLDTVVFLLKKT